MLALLRPAFLPWLIGLLIVPRAAAQEVVRQFALDRITTADGLPQGMVQDILQDRQGYLWCTTKDGLARSDGYAFTIFKHDANDSTSIAGDHTNLLYEDEQGFIWVAVFGVGLDRYDPRKGVFEHVRMGPDVPRTAYDALTHIEEAPDGNIWCVSGYRDLCVVVVDRQDPLTLRPAAAIHPRAGLPVGISTFTFSKDLLWAVTDDRLLAIPLQATEPRTIPDRALPRPTLSAVGELEPHQLLHREQEGELVLGLPGHFLRIATATGEVLDSLPVPALPRLMEMQLVDEADRLWYRCDDGVVRGLDLGTGALEHFTFTADEQDVYAHMQTVFFSCKDRQGNIWGGTKGFGMLKLGRNSTRFSTRPADPIVGYYVDQYEVLGCRQFAMTRHRLGLLPYPSPHEPERNGFGTPAGERNWEGAATDSQGRTWGLLTRGDLEPRYLCYIDAAGTKYRATGIDLKETPNRVLHGRGDEIWVTTATDGGPSNVRNGLLRIDTRRMAVTGRYQFPVDFLLSKYWPISQWSIAPDGVIWMATIEGLLALDPGTGNWRVFQHDPRDPTSIPHDLLFSLCPDPEQPERFLWLGTEGKGMVRFDKESGQCERYTTRQGLPNNVVYSILPGADGRLWVATNNGLCRFDPASGAVRTFTQADGIAGNEFNRYGAVPMLDGSLFFDGMDGGTRFMPGDLKEDDVAAPTVLTGVRLASRDLPMHALWDSAHASSYTLTVPYDEPLVTIRFALMDHTAPQRNRFRYRLEGYTEGWIDSGTRYEATFTNLDPGSYTFVVEGSNSAGLRDGKGASLLLIVTPPWWGTWLARGAALVLILALLYTAHRLRLQQQLRVVRLREHIARDLHDEIGSTLSSVALYGAVAKKKIAAISPESGRLLERISEGTTSAMESMNDIVWTVNAAKDSMADMAERMQSYATQICEARGVALDFDVDAALLAGRMDMGQRKNIYLLYKEAVNNAVKYAECTTITVRITTVDKGFRLMVTDDGRGFDPHAMLGNGLGGNGLDNMRKRAADAGGVCTITSLPGEGTTVAFLSRDLVRTGASHWIQ
ncbi:MAG TPA: two-component regulator propeller domain-containing protein [Flavobacteriales bacterium]|nr:two-component regulator propeller domain-containing protein [Flavobacteriales bacterium]HMR29229.1 two-component regulator propeller domain-containing protein [Flavobacteriales bacterium]